MRRTEWAMSSVMIGVLSLGYVPAYANSDCGGSCVDAHGIGVDIVTLRKGEHEYKITREKEEDPDFCMDRFPLEA